MICKILLKFKDNKIWRIHFNWKNIKNVFNKIKDKSVNWKLKCNRDKYSFKSEENKDNKD